MSSRTARWILMAAAAVLLLPAAAPAQETYRVVLKQPGKGEPALYRRLMRFRVEATIFDKEKTSQEGHKQEKARDLTFRQQVLQPPTGAGEKGKLRRHYTRAERVENGEKKALPYAGKTVLIEKKSEG